VSEPVTVPRPTDRTGAETTTPPTATSHDQLPDGRHPMTQAGWFAAGADATGTIPAVPRPTDEEIAAMKAATVLPLGGVYGGDDKWQAALGPRHALAGDPGPVPDWPDEWRTEYLSRDARDLHGVGCPIVRGGCAWGGDVEGHYGVDFEQLAEDWRIRTLAEAVRDGVLEAPQPRKWPTEAKVKAGTDATLAATVTLAVITVALEQSGAIGLTFGGRYPWLQPVLVLAGVVLPPIAQRLAGYNAPHTPRTGVDR
jgi:hypothetical protein